MKKIKNIFYIVETKKILLVYVLLFIQSLLYTSISYAEVNYEIMIDSSAHSLVAPDAIGYQWYYNNEIIQGGRDQALIIDKSGYYSVEVKEEDGSFSRKDILVVVQAGAIKRIYLIGDSTVQDYTAGYYPRKGWGQMLPFFFNSANVSIINKAVGGTSSKSYYNSFWAPVKNVLQPGDFVFIQFGINDRAADTARHTDATTFKAYLTKFVNETKAKGAIPVLVSTLVRNSWNADGVTVYPAYHDDPVSTRELAAAINVPLIDLDKKSTALLQSVGKAYSTAFIYNNYQPGEYPNYPNGNADDVHLQEMGAMEMARLVVEGIKELNSDPNVSTLIPSLVPTFPVTVTTNNTTAGLITRTTTYPSGVTVTLKTIPNTGFTFSKWTDGSNATAATTVKFTTVMASTAKSYKANYTTAGNTPPTVSLTAPLNNASFIAPASITITANAADANGTVTNVQFFNGTTLLGTDATSPYSFSWTNVAVGTYNITAKATDNGGAVTTSAAVSIKVTAACTPTIITPYIKINTGAWTQTMSTTLNVGGTVILGPQPATGGSWKWTGPNGFTSTAREVTISNIQSSQAGNYVATYTNAAGCTSSSTSTITVIAANVAPTVNISSPANNATFTSPASITITATATDADGTVSSVAFFNGTTLLGSDATTPYSFSWTSVTAGTYSITAKATDNSGAVTTTTPVNITVTIPTITIQAETACLVDGILLESINAGFNGSGYVNANNVAGSTASWSLYSTSNQTVNLIIRYANASANNRTMSLRVNDVIESSVVNFPGTGAWTSWTTSTVSIGLNVGSNILRLTSLTAEGAPNIDELTFGSNTISASSCGTSVVAPNPTSGSFTLSVSEAVQSFTINNNMGTEVFIGGAIAVGGSTSFGGALGSGTYTLHIYYTSGRTEIRTIQKIL